MCVNCDRKKAHSLLWSQKEINNNKKEIYAINPLFGSSLDDDHSAEIDLIRDPEIDEWSVCEKLKVITWPKCKRVVVLGMPQL